jgi:hypothetical protein
MAGSADLRAFVRRAIEEATKLPYGMGREELREWVLVFDGGAVSALLASESYGLLDRIIAEERQGTPDQPPLLYCARSKGGVVYLPPALTTTEQKNRYLIRRNINLVRNRDKAAITRDAIEAAGDRAVPLFVVGLALEPEEGEEIRIQPMNVPRLQLNFADWLAQDQFGSSDEDSDFRDTEE